MRIEDEKTRDVIVYEKRYKAEEVLASVKKWKRGALVWAAAGAVVLFAAMISFIVRAYDEEKVALMAILVGALVLGVIAVYFAGGSVKAKSAKRFAVGCSLLRKWNNALADFEVIEEKSLEKTAMPGEIDKYEEKLVSLADKIAEFENM